MAGMRRAPKVRGMSEDHLRAAPKAGAKHDEVKAEQDALGRTDVPLDSAEHIDHHGKSAHERQRWAQLEGQRQATADEEAAAYERHWKSET